MNLRLVSTALVALVLGGGLAYWFTGGAVRAPRPVITTGKALVGGPFNLIDTSGKPVSDRDFRGRYLLVFFGYTYCPDVCPAALQVISAALDQLGPIEIDLGSALGHMGPMYVKSSVSLAATSTEPTLLARAPRTESFNPFTNSRLVTSSKEIDLTPSVALAFQPHPVVFSMFSAGHAGSIVVPVVRSTFSDGLAPCLRPFADGWMGLGPHVDGDVEVGLIQASGSIKSVDSAKTAWT